MICVYILYIIYSIIYYLFIYLIIDLKASCGGEHRLHTALEARGRRAARGGGGDPAEAPAAGAREPQAASEGGEAGGVEKGRYA